MRYAVIQEDSWEVFTNPRDVPIPALLAEPWNREVKRRELQSLLDRAEIGDEVIINEHITVFVLNDNPPFGV
jgi:hypothetical protein